jgi:hypothetical protein
LAEGGTTGFWATACHEIPANAEKRNDEIIRDDRFISSLPGIFRQKLSVA